MSLRMDNQVINAEYSQNTSIKLKLVVKKTLSLESINFENIGHIIAIQLIKNFQASCKESTIIREFGLIKNQTLNLGIELSLFTFKKERIDTAKVIDILKSILVSYPFLEAIQEEVIVKHTNVETKETVTLTSAPFRKSYNYSNRGERTLTKFDFQLPLNSAEIPNNTKQFKHNAFNEVVEEVDGSATLNKLTICLSPEAGISHSSSQATGVSASNSSISNAVPINKAITYNQKTSIEFCLHFDPPSQDNLSESGSALCNRLIAQLNFPVWQIALQFGRDAIGRTVILRVTLNIFTHDKNQKIIDILTIEKFLNTNIFKNCQLNENSLKIANEPLTTSETIRLARSVFRESVQYNALGHVLGITMNFELPKAPNIIPGQTKYERDISGRITAATNGNALINIMSVQLESKLAQETIASTSSAISNNDTLVTSRESSTIINLTIESLISEAEKLTIGKVQTTMFINSLKSGDYDKALRQACAAGEKELVELLVKYNKPAKLHLDWTSTSTNKHTPLMWAVKSQNNELINYINGLLGIGIVLAPAAEAIQTTAPQLKS